MRKNNSKRLFSTAHDLFMAAISFVISLYLRLGSDEFYKTKDYLIPGTILFTATCALVFWLTNLNRAVWRYTSIKDLFNIFKSVSLSILIFLPLLFIYNRLELFPRSMLIINWLVLISLLSATRLFNRISKDKSFSLISQEDRRIPVILVGLNQYSEFFLREAARKLASNYNVIAIIDEDKGKRGRYAHNIEIMGQIKSIPHVIKQLRASNTPAQKIIIAPDYVQGEKLENIIKYANKEGLTIARLPRLTEFKDNLNAKIEMRPILIEDLLGRPQNVLNRNLMQELVKDKTVLITGAGGTIGGEIARQIASFSPKKIILFELSEYGLYGIDRDITSANPTLEKLSIIGDIREPKTLEKIFSENSPEVVFHAAAIKHVPIAEDNIEEAILTNVMGTRNIAEVAAKHKAQAVVLISTDKAVNPTNVMGATKRLAEYYFQHMQQKETATKFVTVRFGNVLGSTGSVVPLFQKQLANGGPLTVTHKDMTRYFMTVREAVELVIMASAIAAHNKVDKGIFVLDMGTPVKIYDLAVQIIKLAGFEPEKDIKIEFTGIRPGEKLYEELFYNEEKLQKLSESNSIMFSELKSPTSKSFLSQLEEIISTSKNYDRVAALNQLKALVPEFKN